VALSDAKLAQSSQNSTHGIIAQAGDAVWIDQRDAKFENLAALAKFILISFSPSKTQ